MLQHSPLRAQLGLIWMPPTPPQPTLPLAHAYLPQLASFLSELETSGLLTDGEGAAADAAAEPPAGEVPLGPEPEAGSRYQQQGTAGEEGAADGDGVAGVQQVGVKEGAGEGEGDADAGGGGGAAEQRVLGDVPGAEGWCRVQDMGSGQVYYWHEMTNEVAWDPPEGALEAGDAGSGGALVEAAGADVPMTEAVAAPSVVGESEEAPAGEAAQQPQHQQQEEEEGQERAAADAAGARAAGQQLQAEAEAGAGGREHAAHSAGRRSAGSPGREGPAPAASLPAGLLATPSEEALAAAAAVAQRCSEAAGSWLDTVPQVGWYAEQKWGSCKPWPCCCWLPSCLAQPSRPWVAACAAGAATAVPCCPHWAPWLPRAGGAAGY